MKSDRPGPSIAAERNDRNGLAMTAFREGGDSGSMDLRQPPSQGARKSQ